MNWGYVLTKSNRVIDRLTGFTPFQRMRVSLLLACILAMFFVTPFTHARSAAGSDELIEYLTQEKMRLGMALNATRHLAPAESMSALKKQQEDLSALQALNKAAVDALEGFAQSQSQRELEYSARLKSLQQAVSPNRTVVTNAKQRINQLVTEVEITRKSLALIREDLDLAREYETVLKANQRILEVQEASLDLQAKIAELKAREHKLQAIINARFATNIAFQNARNQDTSSGSASVTAIRVMLNNQAIRLLQDEIDEINLQKKLTKADFELFRNADLRTLESVNAVYSDSIHQLESIEAALKKRIAILNTVLPTIHDAALLQEAHSLIRKIRSRLEGTVIQQQTLQEDLENRQKQLSNQLSARQSLAGDGDGGWSAFVAESVQIPSQFYGYLKSLFVKVTDNYLWLDTLPALLMWGSVLLCVSLLGTAWYFLRNYLQTRTSQRLAGHLYQAVLSLFWRNLPGLAIAACLLLVLWQCHVPLSHYQLLLNLFGVWLVFRILVLSARMVLMERVSDASGHDVRLYHRIKRLLIAGGWITGLMVFSHQLLLGEHLQDLSTRLFMVFLLAVSGVLWKSREVVNWLLLPARRMRKRYFRNSIHLLTILAPLTVFATAVTGLAGYVNLAWTMSKYEVYVLFALTSWTLLRGLLSDGMELLSEWMVTSLQNGWVWIELVLKPLDKVLRVVLFVLCLGMLFRIVGWGPDSTVMTHLVHIARYPFIDFSGIRITLLSTLQFLVLVSVVVWASKWTREFSWRWLYRNARDSGIRNSLSVFTQYAIALTGGFIALRVLGFDFAGMSMILGGLAVGMGFGLRDFASNIVGGLMLLIERPVREGDLVTIGDHEGKVAHIGIRSMRVSSWDNMEVLIPNAETFNKPFTNWTHQDNIVRTVVPIKVSRADDPQIVQQLLLDAIADIPEILTEPPPQALLAQIDDALIAFEVRYFINVAVHTRFEVRSKLLFAITEKFRANHIQAPVPPLRVELKDTEQSLRHAEPT